MKTVKYVLILITLVGCHNDGGYQQSLDNEAKGAIILTLGDILRKANEITYTYDVTDQMDGSVMLQETSSKGDVKTYYYKKCLQGQVYRQTENDCMGTGNETDLYGAVKLQYCDKADNSCNGGEDKGILDGNGKSEAYKSCDSDTTLGRKWEVAEYHILIFSISMYKELSSKNIKVWRNKSIHESLATYSNVGSSSTVFTSTNKTDKLNVLCISN